MRLLTRALAVGGLALVTITACGSDDSPSGDSAAAVTGSVGPTTTGGSTPPSDAATSAESATGGTTDSSGTAGEAADPDAPQRIVSLSPTSTETLFAIGAGDQVIAVDEQSNYPAEAAALRSGLSSFPPNIEAIAALEPDLVVHDGTQDIDAELAELGIETFAASAPESMDGIYAQIEELGATTGHTDEAAALVADMKIDVDKAVDSVTVVFETAPRIYHELDNTLFSINSNTFIGHVYGLFGLQNIADTAEGGSNYPQLSAEFIVSQNPDLIFLADSICCGETPEKVAARPGWDGITAVQSGNIIPVDEDIASRWGPRIVEYVEFVAETVNGLGTPSGG